MTTQASVIINFFDHPDFCKGPLDECNYLVNGRCSLRVKRPNEVGVGKFLLLKSTELGFYLKDPSCKFIWKKAQIKKMKCPFKDFEDNELFEGDKINHFSGESGIIKFLPQKKEPCDQWKVDYGSGPLSSLILQIGDKGRAVKLK